MAQQRIRGQECSVIIVANSEVQNELTDIQNFNWSHVAETMVEEYLGETHARTDDIYKHAKGDFEMHLHEGDEFASFVQSVKNRQQRLAPDLQFNISLVETFANGQVRTIVFNDVKFGEIPENVPARGGYVKVKLDFVCDDYEVNVES